MSAAPCPWADIDEDGANLTVDLLPSVPFVRLADMFRRNVTAPYADLYELTVPQWRVLALMGHFSPVPFGMLVTFSGSDKALVSRAVRQLEERGLAQVLPDTQGNKKKLTWALTPEGEAIYHELMPIAQKRAAGILNSLSRTERITLYTVLGKLERACSSAPESANE
jgi:DNA-binding MarR family transcriptional regulator